MKKGLIAAASPLNLLRRNLKSLIGFELVYRLLTILVFFPLLTWMQRLFLVANRSSNIAAYNVKQLYRNPFAWLIMLVMMTLLTIFALFERFALVDALHASKVGRRLSVKEIFSTGFDLCVDRFRLRNIGLIPYTIGVLHFGTLYDTSSITSFISIPGYILEGFEKRPWQKYTYYFVIAVMVYLFLRLIYSIPVMMEHDDVNFFSAMIKSWKMTKGFYIFRVMLQCAVWVLIGQLVYLGISFLVILAWYLLSLWLQPGATAPIVSFFKSNFVPVYAVCYVFFLWTIGPILLAGFQGGYYRRKLQMEEPVLAYTEEAHYLRKHPFLKAATILIIAVIIFFAGPRRFAQVKWMMKTDYGVPLIMAHRGYSAAAPENTMPAFQKAIDEEFTAAELDVQMTKDGVIVLLHDKNLKRTTGVNKNIWDVTYDEIKNLDCGKSFSKEFAGTTIPTLDEVLKLCKGNLWLNIEIKRTGHDDGIVEKVIELILANDFIDQCDITSQDYETIRQVKELNPDILTAYTSVIGMGDIQNLEAADIISIQETFANYENVSKLHRAGKRVFVWTVNEESTMERLVSLNVDAILTNHPARCKEVINRYSSKVTNIFRRIKNILEYI